MHYVAIIEGKEREVEVTEVAPGRYRLLVEDTRMEVDAHMVAGATMSVLVDSTVYDVEIEKRPEGVDNLLVRGHVVPVEVLDLRRMRLRRAQEAAGGPDGPVTINSPMPGKVVAVLAKQGDAVAEGQGVVVVEAMKMENELRSPKAGVVTELPAEVGVAVDGGAVLARIE